MEKSINQVFAKAIKAYQEDKLEEAQSIYKEILKIEPTHVDANYNLAIIELTMKNTEVALSLLKKTLIAKPYFAEAYSNLGIALRRLSRFKEAEINYKKAIQLKPDFVDAYFNLGNTLSDMGKLDEAKINYKKVIELKPEHITAYLNLGTLLHKSHDKDKKNKIEVNFLKLEEAEILFRTVIKIEPDNFTINHDLGYTLKALGKFKEAEFFFNKAIQLKPDYAAAYSNLGTILLEDSQRLNEAETCFKQAISIDPEIKNANLDLQLTLKIKKLLSSIGHAKNFENKNRINFIKKLSVKLFGSDLRLVSNPFISHINVEKELLSDLYKINTNKLDSTNIDSRYLRYGNGECSDYQLFTNNLNSIKKVANDLTNIMKQAVKSDIFIMESFFNIFRAGSGIISHNHTGNFDKANGLVKQKYSLTYHLSIGDQTCSEPGILKLEDPYKEILPTKGMVMIFPADRMHSAAYNGSIDRVMIGVNFYSLT